MSRGLSYPTTSATPHAAAVLRALAERLGTQEATVPLNNKSSAKNPTIFCMPPMRGGGGRQNNFSGLGAFLNSRFIRSILDIHKSGDKNPVVPFTIPHTFITSMDPRAFATTVRAVRDLARVPPLATNC